MLGGCELPAALRLLSVKRKSEGWLYETPAVSANGSETGTRIENKEKD
jgi:hypothetical protein